MWTLHCAGELDADLRRALLAHASEHVRAWAVRLSGDGRELEPDELRALAELARSDGSGLVRLAIASAMPAVPAGPAWRLASALAARAEDADDAYMPRMIWFGIAPHVAGDLDRAFRLAETTRLPALGDFIRWYAATTNQGLDRALASLGGDPETADPETIAHRLGLVAFARRDAWLREPPAIWSAISAQLYAHDDARIRARAESLGASFSDGVVLAKLRASLGESDTRPAERRRAFDVLSRSADRESLPRFLELVDDPAFTSDAITVLARYDAPEIPVVLLARFARLSSGDRQRALATLTARASFAVPLLEVIAAGAVDRKALTSFHIRQLRSLRDKRADALVAELWGDAREASDDVRARIAELGKTYRDAPLWAFESAGGKASFDKLCASCHASTDSAGELGPDLAGSGRNGAEYFLESILDPNAVVGEDFRLSVIVTKTGSVLSGVVREETPERLTLRTPTERIVIEKSAIASREKQSASLMPEGLLDTLEERQVIELLKYLSGL
jgi:putative heme-binding domain-containing protein